MTPIPYTDEELAEIRRTRFLTVGDWDRMTPVQRMQDIQDFIKELIAHDGYINKLDPYDPAWARDRNNDEPKDY